ncbi:MAG: FKBP-type peptidyl-prolyl cis-trans isomerase FkpA [Frankiaceae bacterium]|nr:FKBP-type peptidyl-prolyl cis-trans isomerase FkpA [Frankiaceae bacterium]
MARSRQRERELARRRYERRRLREQQLRARRRRRNTIIGATVGTLAVIGGLVFLLLYVVLGGNDKSKVNANATPSTPPSVSPTATPSTPPSPTGPCAPIKPNPPAKGQPTIPPVNGPRPATLKVKDVKIGKGKVAKAGSSLSVSYIGVSCSTGQVFDATYKDGGKPFTVSPLGTAGVIAGWNQGLIGVRAGGVRELIIPPSLGYGPNGSGPIAPNETLIFLVTVESVK